MADTAWTLQLIRSDASEDHHAKTVNRERSAVYLRNLTYELIHAGTPQISSPAIGRWYLHQFDLDDKEVFHVWYVARRFEAFTKNSHAKGSSYLRLVQYRTRKPTTHFTSTGSLSPIFSTP